MENWPGTLEGAKMDIEVYEASPFQERWSMRRLGRLAVIASVLGVLLAANHPAGAQDEPFPVGLRVGEAFDVCASKEIVCPARIPICDDPKVAVPVDLPGGLGFRGIGPGTTLCSAASAVGPRRVFRITVR